MIPDVTPNGVFYLPPTGWLTSFYNPPNDCSKENTRVNVNPDIITLFNQNDIIPVKYSERNKFIKELAM
ncbi:FIG00743109: hypothetical protein [Limosilactobacillus reuteri]|uniref:Uncharacterized protein n=1 Tax=Limosilactobacillus reuteri TaxID=1598 RepID=A0A0U5FGP5_LIMRT|nr:FIG00743109: hypothetical protein [Limosilactobacillus reuteri]